MLSTKHYQRNLSGGFIDDITGGAAGKLSDTVTNAAGQVIQGTENAAGQIIDAAGNIIGLTAAGVAHAAQETAKQAAMFAAPILQAVEGAVTGIVNNVGHVVNWDVARNAVGELVRDYGNMLVIMEPTHYMSDFLASNPVTGHAFGELDKFSGGMLTSQKNVSTLPGRALRGDAISKQELARDAIYGLQVLAVAMGGAPALGGILGNMVGNEACKTIQNNDQKAACQVAFTIVGAVTGGAVASAASAPAGASTDVFEHSFSEKFVPAVEKAFSSKVVAAASQVAVAACKNGQWAGPTECAILGRIAADYVNAGTPGDWVTFLGKEAGQIGVGLLLQSAFPSNSPEHRAIGAALLQPNVPPQIAPGSSRGRITYAPPGTVYPSDSGILPWLIGAGALAAAALS